MSNGLKTTFAVLAKSQNEAAVRLLRNALDAADPDVRTGALRALLSHRSAAADAEVIRRWHTFSKRWKGIVSDSNGRLTTEIRNALLGTDDQLHANGCDAALTLREYDLIPALITAAEDKSSPLASRSTATLLQLADALEEELSAPRNYYNRRDPHVVRSHVIAALERSVERFDQHQSREIVEAFLVLAGHENPVLKHILQHPHDKAYVTLLHLLSHSPRPGVMRLLLDSLDQPRISSAIYSILAHRNDIAFVRQMLMRFVDEVPRSMKKNLKRVDSFSWLQNGMQLVAELNGEEQQGAIKLTLASGMSRIGVFEVIEFILEHGTPEGRREAARALAEFRGVEADDAVLRAIEDDDSTVRAIAVGQLRERNIRGAITTLFELLDSPDRAVYDASREALSEFTFERFLATFGALDDAAIEETGRIVKRVDPLAIDGLRNELASPLRARRIRAIQMAVAMQAIPECESNLIALLSDEDQVLRSAAAEVLVHCPTNTTRRALRDAILDRSQIVRDAVERTLQTLAQHEVPPASLAPTLLSNSNHSGPSLETGEAVT